MIPSLAVRSRQCLIEDVKSLETQLLHLQERFDLIVNWIREQYCELSGLPDYVLKAVRGDKGSIDKNKFKRDTFTLKETEFVKVEKYPSYEDLNNLDVDNGIATDNLIKNSIPEQYDEISKVIETVPEFRYCNQPVTTSSLLLQSERESDVKLENEEEQVTSSIGCKKEIRGNFDQNIASYNANVDFDQNTANDHLTDPLTFEELMIQEKQAKENSVVLKRVKKTDKHLQANRDSELILDAIDYKSMTESLPKSRLTCAVCHKNFSTPLKVRRHEVEVHLTKEDQSKIRNRSSIPEVPTMCDICNVPFKNIDAHKLNHLPPEVITTVEGSRRPHYRCLKCDQLFSDKKKYLNHIARDCKAEELLENSNYAQHTSKPRTKRTYLCNHCGQSFKRTNDLKRHEVAVHLKRKDFKCQFCERSFAHEYMKNMHEKKHLGTSNVTCDLCGFTFTCKQILRNHIRGVHENQRPFQCSLCEKSFKTSHARNYHINTHGNPNSRKRALNRAIDPVQAAAKRRHCETFKKNRLQRFTDSIAAEDEDVNSVASNENN